MVSQSQIDKRTSMDAYEKKHVRHENFSLLTAKREAPTCELKLGHLTTNYLKSLLPIGIPMAMLQFIQLSQ